MANRTNAGASMLPVTAVHPMSGGMAPATAPTRSDAVVRRFSGVDTRGEKTSAGAAGRPGGGATTNGGSGTKNAAGKKPKRRGQAGAQRAAGRGGGLLRG